MFAYYEYDDPIPVEGTVHVGMVQEMDLSLNIGLDKNTDYNFRGSTTSSALGPNGCCPPSRGRPRSAGPAGRGRRRVRGRGGAGQRACGLGAGGVAESGERSIDAGVVRSGPPGPLVVGGLVGTHTGRGTLALGSDRTVLAVADVPRGLALVVIEGADGTAPPEGCPALMAEELPEEALPDGDELFEHHRIVADKGQSLRVDKFLFNLLPNTSRNRPQMAAKSGYVRVNGKAVKSNYKVVPTIL